MTIQTLDQYLQHLEHGNVNQRAAAIALRPCNGAHHQQWVIDQMLRLIAGKAYPTLIEKFESEGNKWDTGIAP